MRNKLFVIGTLTLLISLGLLVTKPFNKDLKEPPNVIQVTADMFTSTTIDNGDLIINKPPSSFDSISKHDMLVFPDGSEELGILPIQKVIDIKRAEDTITLKIKPGTLLDIMPENTSFSYSCEFPSMNIVIEP